MAGDFLVALALAVLMLALLLGLLGWGRRGEVAAGWGAALFAFLILLFGIWAGGAWIRPAGPVAAGISWVPLLVVGLVIVFMLAALLPPPRRRASPPAPPGDSSAALGYTIFFWLLMALFWLALLAAYF